MGAGSLPVMDGEIIDDPPLYYATSGYNNIHDNGNNTSGGPSDNDGSEIYIYNANVQMSEGCNSIVDNRTPGDTPPYATKLLMNGSSFQGLITVHAEHNYWGDNPLYRLSERFGSLNVYYNPVWSQPCTQEESGQGLLITSSIGTVIDTVYPSARTVDTLSNTNILYAKANKKFLDADFNGAENMYNQILNSDDTLFAKIQACQRLYEIGIISKKPSSFFDDLYSRLTSMSSTTKDSLMQKVLVQLGSLSLVGKEQYILAIGEFDQVIESDPESEEAVYAEIDALTTSLLIDNGDSTLHKSKLVKYLVNRDGYQDRVNQLLQKRFGSSQEIQKNEIIPKDFELYQNYPNPFNPVTTIKYDLPRNATVTLKIYDILGREVKTLVDHEFKSAGSYKVVFNASHLASGIYLFKLQTNDYMNVKKMVLLK